MTDQNLSLDHLAEKISTLPDLIQYLHLKTFRQSDGDLHFKPEYEDNYLSGMFLYSMEGNHLPNVVKGNPEEIYIPEEYQDRFMVLYPEKTNTHRSPLLCPPKANI